jgi:hypothetical protein
VCIYDGLGLVAEVEKRGKYTVWQGRLGKKTPKRK